MTRKTFQHKFIIDKSIHEVFPLFTAEGEKLWAPGWDYLPVFGDQNVREDDMFLTQTHDHSAADAIWIVKKYDSQNHFVQYYKIEPGEKVGLVSVQCNKINETETEVVVSYAYTALSPSGELFISHFNEQQYIGFINEWKKLIDDYFARS